MYFFYNSKHNNINVSRNIEKRRRSGSYSISDRHHLWLTTLHPMIIDYKKNPQNIVFCGFYKVLNGFEPMIRELQSHALPLGYSTTLYNYGNNPSEKSDPDGN